MPAVKDSLWRLARGGQPIDAEVLASAIEEQAEDDRPDFRTRLLIRDAIDALSVFWGQDRTLRWLARSPMGERIEPIRCSDLGPAGFPTLVNRIMDATKPATVLQFFRELGSRVSKPARLDVGGSTALILAETLSRHTDDIDVVDEVPAEIRAQHDLLDDMARRYGLKLAHFQSHYLPAGWSDRVRSLGRFGLVDVFLVDAFDVLVGKLFSTREKNLDDLRAAALVVDKQSLESRLKRAAGSLLGEPQLAENARRNWYIVFGEALPA